MNEISVFYLRHNKEIQPPPIRAKAIQFFDLTLVLEGEFHYRLNGRDVTLLAGDAILFVPGDLRERCPADCRTDYVSFNFYVNGDLSLPAVMRGTVDREIKLLISTLDTIRRSRPAAGEEISAPVLHAILLLLREATRRKHSPLTEQILSFLGEHLGERITLEEIGRLTFFSPVYCDTVFKKEMGRSIIDYLLELRVSEAKKLILAGTHSLNEIAELTGFGDSNYLSRVFKKRTGYTPMQYKKSH